MWRNPDTGCFAKAKGPWVSVTANDESDIRSLKKEEMNFALLE
jgi:hypothetical protein